MNREFKRRLPNAQTVKDMYSITEEMAEKKKARDVIIKDILAGRDKRLLLIIGPCSADREDSVLDYIGRLRTVQDQVKDKIVIIPRIYTNKHLATRDGGKGSRPQPAPCNSPGYYRNPQDTHESAGADRFFLRGRDALPGKPLLFVRYAVVCGGRRAFRRKPAAPPYGERTWHSGRYEEPDRR